MRNRGKEAADRELAATCAKCHKPLSWPAPVKTIETHLDLAGGRALCSRCYMGG